MFALQGIRESSREHCHRNARKVDRSRSKRDSSKVAGDWYRDIGKVVELMRDYMCQPQLGAHLYMQHGRGWCRRGDGISRDGVLKGDPRDSCVSCK
jgi:hypothetical protein